MMSHARVWAAIDMLAERYGMSVSGLARKAGLDATSFNRSKRKGPEGRDRWPSTESIAKILNATGAPLSEFMHLISPDVGAGTKVPVIGMAQAGSGRMFTEDGMPVEGPGWEGIDFPSLPTDGVFAIEVQGDSMRPLYREGDVVIVSRAAAIRRGDRIVVRTHEGEVMAKELKRRTVKGVELTSMNADHPDRMVPFTDITWMARIMWARQ